jgi:hypothetical protein
MTDKNPHTGDTLISKVNTKEYEENYDRIFGVKDTLTDSDKKCECFHWGTCCGASGKDK